MTEEIRAKVLEALEAVAPVNFEAAKVVAAEFGLKDRAVVAMCTRNGIAYARKERTAKDGTPVVSKSDLVGKIAEALDVEASDLDGLDKANKTALTAVLGAIFPVTFEAE